LSFEMGTMILAVSAIPAVYNVVEPHPAWVCCEFGLE